MTAVAEVKVDGLEVESFTVSLDRGSEYGTARHFERDHDLEVGVKGARRGGTVAGIVLVELGIDGYDTHLARVDFGSVDRDAECRYRTGDSVRALTDAIDCLTLLRDQLARMESTHA